MAGGQEAVLCGGPQPSSSFLNVHLCSVLYHAACCGISKWLLPDGFSSLCLLKVGFPGTRRPPLYLPICFSVLLVGIVHSLGSAALLSGRGCLFLLCSPPPQSLTQSPKTWGRYGFGEPALSFRCTPSTTNLLPCHWTSFPPSNCYHPLWTL